MPDYYTQDFVPDFDKLWEEKYMAVYMSWARRNAYLYKLWGSAEDLFSDLYFEVWSEVVAKWPEYAGHSLRPEVGAWSGYMLKRYFKNLVVENGFKKNRMRAGEMSMSVSTSGSDEGDGGDGIIENPFECGEVDKETTEDLSPHAAESLIKRIADPVAKRAFQLLLENVEEPLGVTWKLIARDVGLSEWQVKQRVYNNEDLYKYFANKLKRTQHEKQKGTHKMFMGAVDDGWGENKSPTGTSTMPSKQDEEEALKDDPDGKGKGPSKPPSPPEPDPDDDGDIF